MPFDSLAFSPEVPPDLPDEQQGRRIRDILAGWAPRAIAAPRRAGGLGWRPCGPAWPASCHCLTNGADPC